MSVDEASLREALGTTFDVNGGALDIEYGLEHHDLLVFSASVRDVGSPVSATFDGSIELDLERNIARVLLLADRDMSLGPRELAAAIGILEAVDGRPFLDQDAVDLGGDPVLMTPPRFVEIDGVRTLEYWNASPQAAPWRSQLKIHSDGSFTRQQAPYTAVKAGTA